jgi:transcriptional regulator with XRE-family HTH domain
MSTLPPRTPENIKAFRQRAGWTQEKACEMACIHDRQTWRKYENGTLKMSEERWRLAHFMANLHPDFDVRPRTKAAA